MSKFQAYYDSWGISCNIAIMRLSLNLPGNEWKLVQVTVLRRQAISHYLRPYDPIDHMASLGHNRLTKNEKMPGYVITYPEERTIALYMFSKKKPAPTKLKNITALSHFYSCVVHCRRWVYGIHKLLWYNTSPTVKWLECNISAT